MTARRVKRREPDIIYTKSFLQPPGSQEELREILLMWEMALVRSVRAKMKKEM